MEANPCSNPVNDPLLNPIQAAHFLGISRATVERMARGRKVPGIKIGKLWRFRRSDLEAWIDSQVSAKHTKVVP
jgi:excisionase family DNA binding protein